MAVAGKRAKRHIKIVGGEDNHYRRVWWTLGNRRSEESLSANRTKKKRKAERQDMVPEEVEVGGQEMKISRFKSIIITAGCGGTGTVWRGQVIKFVREGTLVNK